MVVEVEGILGKSWDVYIMIMGHFQTTTTRSKSELNEILLISQEHSLFPNSIEEQEKLKEEDKGFEVSNQDFVDYSSIRYGF